MWHRVSVKAQLTIYRWCERWEKNEGDFQEFFNHFVSEIPHIIGPLTGGGHA